MSRALTTLALVGALLVGCVAQDEHAPANPFAVVMLTGPSGRCSGVVISDTEIATARHCVQIGIVQFGGEIPIRTAMNPRRDIAIVWVASTHGHPHAEVAVTWPAIGDATSLVGYGCTGELEMRPQVFAGASELWGPEYPANIDTVGRSCPGDSGGALFDDAGKLVGVHQGAHDTSRVRSIAVDAALLVDLAAVSP